MVFVDEMFAEPDSDLSPMERVAVAVGRFTNETKLAKKVQQKFLRQVTTSWIGPFVARRTYVNGLERIMHLNPNRGVVIASNHRSFFDFYVLMLAIFSRGTPLNSSVIWEPPSVGLHKPGPHRAVVV